ncbi:MAG: hypothetical protein GY853_06135 [PVC group bacterium]|nr:hypothetical protein [PVC group bacterium]
MEKEYKCPDCKQDLVKKEDLIFECPDCQKTFELKQGQLISLRDESDMDDEDDDEIEKIDDDLEFLEGMDLLEDGL